VRSSLPLNRIVQRLSEMPGRKNLVWLAHALEDKIQKTGRPFNRTKVDALCARIGALPVADARTSEEILGYDEFGIPR
jgi:hypothetical protein